MKTTSRESVNIGDIVKDRGRDDCPPALVVDKWIPDDSGLWKWYLIKIEYEKNGLTITQVLPEFRLEVVK